MCKAPIVLASASPRRRTLLAALGVPFVVVVPHVEEVDWPNRPEDAALANARLKNTACRAERPGDPILSADTVLDFKGALIGKPPSLDAAFDMFRQLSGHTHDVITAVALSTPAEPDPTVHAIRSSVTFKVLDDHAIASYFELVNPLDKAGAYDIDQHPEIIIATYAGSRTNIMGLPTEWICNHLIIRCEGAE